LLQSSRPETGRNPWNIQLKSKPWLKLDPGRETGIELYVNLIKALGSVEVKRNKVANGLIANKLLLLVYSKAGGWH
jgi:hypothetical protein